jgi:hypothetical protein
MANPSPACTVNGGSVPADVAAGSTVTVALASAAGVVQPWYLTVLTADETTNVATVNASLVINQVAKTATFTAPSTPGSCVILQSTIGIGNATKQGTGVDANGNVQSSFTTTFKVNVKTAANLRVLALNEQLEQGSNGWTLMLNAVIRAVAAATLSVSGSGLVHQTSGSTDGTAYKGTAGQFLVTNAAASDTAWATISGDVSASVSTVGKLTVTGLQNVALPAPSGAGTVLTYSGGLLSWAAPATGSFTSITGVDVVAADSAHAYVVSISGSGGAGGTIPINATALQFAAAQTAAGVGHATAGASQSPANFVITPQGPNAGASSGHQTPGNLLVALAAPVGSGTNAFLAVKEGSAGVFSVANGYGFSGLSADCSVWLGANAAPGTANSNNWTIQRDTSFGNVVYSAPNANAAAMTVYDAGDCNFQTGLTGSTLALIANGNTIGPVQVYMAADLAGGTPGQIAAVAITGNRHFTLLNGINGTDYTTSIPSGDGVTLVANAATVPTSNPSNGALLFATGGNLWCYPSSGSKFQIMSGGGGGSTFSGVDVVAASSSTAYVQSISGNSGAGGAVPVGTASHTVTLQFPNLVNQALIESGTQYFLANDGSNNLEVNALSTVTIQSGGTNVATFVGGTNYGLYPASTGNNFVLGYFSNTTSGATGTDLILQPQFSTNGNGTGGNVRIELMALAGSGSESFLQIQRGGTYNGAFTIPLQLGVVPGSTTFGGIFGSGLVPSNTNYALAASSANTVVNCASSGGQTALAVHATTVLSCSSSAVTINQPISGSGTTGLSLTTQTLSGTISGAQTASPSAPYVIVTATLSADTTLNFPNPDPAGTIWIVDCIQMTSGGFNFKAKVNGGAARALTAGNAYLLVSNNSGNGFNFVTLV